MGPWTPLTSTALSDLRPDALEELWLVDLPEDRADAPVSLREEGSVVLPVSSVAVAPAVVIFSLSPTCYQ